MNQFLHLIPFRYGVSCLKLYSIINQCRLVKGGWWFCPPRKLPNLRALPLSCKIQLPYELKI